LKKILTIGYYHLKNDKRFFRTVKALSKKCQVSYQYLLNEESKIYSENSIKYIPVSFWYKTFRKYFKKSYKKNNIWQKILKIVPNLDFWIIIFLSFSECFSSKIF